MSHRLHSTATQLVSRQSLHRHTTGHGNQCSSQSVINDRPNHWVQHYDFYWYWRGYSVTPKLKVRGVIDSHSFLVDAQISGTMRQLTETLFVLYGSNSDGTTRNIKQYFNSAMICFVKKAEPDADLASGTIIAWFPQISNWHKPTDSRRKQLSINLKNQSIN